MDRDASRGRSPTPLQSLPPERMNQQRESSGFFDATASVTDKIGQFNSLAMQSKQLERKTADAALKRAMLGREEAETEMRRYREEARQLRKQLEDGRDRERRVGERLEAVMENYGRTKETHAHTQALWEKEIRRARKETFKSQSAIVKLQEELKSARASAMATEKALENEKIRSKAREQEAFQARYDLVSCQEELQQTIQRVKLLEQERDAFETLAKSQEDVQSLAAQGQVPLPPPNSEEEEVGVACQPESATQNAAVENCKAEDDRDDSDSSSSRRSNGGQQLTLPKASKRSARMPRLSSATLLGIKSSAASEAEIEELMRMWQWEKQRADRSVELVEFLEAECQLRACSCMRKRPRSSIFEAVARKRPSLDIGDAGDRMLGRGKAAFDQSATNTPSTSPVMVRVPKTKRLHQMNLNALDEDGPESRGPQVQEEKQEQMLEPDQDPDKDHQQHGQGARRSTIFIPEEGVFRTVSQQIAEEMQEAVDASKSAMVLMTEQTAGSSVHDAERESNASTLQAEDGVSVAPSSSPLPPSPPSCKDDNARQVDVTATDDVAMNCAMTASDEPAMYARTPSVDPPSYALLSQPRTSLLSLLDAPHRQEVELPLAFDVPTTPGPLPEADARQEADGRHDVDNDARRPALTAILTTSSTIHNEDVTMEEAEEDEQDLELTVREEASSNTGHTDAVFSHSERYGGVGVAAMELERLGVAGQAEPPVVSQQHISQHSQHQADLQLDFSFDRHSHDQPPRPHTTAAMYAVKTTTTRVPLREENTEPNLAQRLQAAQRTPTHKVVPSLSSLPSLSSSAMYSVDDHDGDDFNGSSGSDGSNGSGASSATFAKPGFDAHNLALTPSTMTREQCLAQIRERRGRARSAAGHHQGGSGGSGVSRGSASGQGPKGNSSAAANASTPRRPVTPGKERREVSAPVGRSIGSVRRIRS